MKVQSNSSKGNILTAQTKKRMGGTFRDKYCYICKSIVSLSNGSMKDHQTKIHGEDLDSIKKSNDTKEYVRSTCKICGEDTQRVLMGWLLQNTKKYDQVYFDLVELVLHQCGICEEYLLLDSDYIAHHLKAGAKTNPHDITHAKYNEKYMTMKFTTSTWNQKPENISAEKLLKITTKKEMNPLMSHMEKKTTTIKENGKKKEYKNKKEETLKSTPVQKEVSDKEQSNFDAAVDALNDEIDNTLKSFCKDNENDSTEVENITVESFRALLDSLSIDGEEIRFPALESLLNMDIWFQMIFW